MPFAEEVVYYEKRVLDLDPPKERMILADQKRLDVDSYARYRITDPLLFYQTTRRVSEVSGKLTPIINSSLRRVLGNETLLDILSGKRATIMVDIQKAVNDAVKRFGMEIVEVRVRRADYPDETRSNIENRMKSEREREAKEFRARGFEMAEGIRADAGKQKIVILAEANKKLRHCVVRAIAKLSKSTQMPSIKTLNSLLFTDLCRPIESLLGQKIRRWSFHQIATFLDILAISRQAIRK